jgi:hypothetical protein
MTAFLTLLEEERTSRRHRQIDAIEPQRQSAARIAVMHNAPFVQRMRMVRGTAEDRIISWLTIMSLEY